MNDDVTPIRPRTPRSGKNAKPRLIWLAVIVLPLLFAGNSLIDLWVELKWFDELGQKDVLLTRIKWGLAMGSAAAVITFAYLMVHARWALRVADKDLFVPFLADPEQDGPDQKTLPVSVLKPLATSGIAVVSVLTGLAMGGRWETVLRWMGKSEFGIEDPRWGNDVSLYVFSLPFYEMIINFLLSITILAVLVSAAIYVASGVIRYTPMLRIAKSTISHGSVLLGIIFLLQAFNLRLQIWSLVRSENAVVTGLGYTDWVIRRPGLWILIVMAVAIAIFLMSVNTRRRSLRLMWTPVALFAGVWIVALGIGPQVFQQFVVEPTELSKENRLLTDNIDLTRHAYGLSGVSERPYNTSENLQFKDLAAEQQTIDNIRVWSPFQLLDVFKQRQAIRPYYEFFNVDIDRYTVKGEYRQMLVAAREVDVTKEAVARKWQNRRLQYTHGYGVAATFVNQANSEGLPVYSVSNIPPQSRFDELQVTRPEIYFGEHSDGDEDPSTSYVIANTEIDEISQSGSTDAEGETGEARVKYQGDGGFAVGGLVNRIGLALRFSDYRIVLNGDIRADSRMMFRRSIQPRITELAPFLALDHDPYLVVIDGRLKWIQDAYTTTDRFPYSGSWRDIAADTDQAQRRIPGRERTNYLRNSVKAVVDAYSGEVTLYIVDGNDPIIRAWDSIFPSLFTDEEMPADIKAHVRYPEELFNIQSSVWTLYHMDDVQTFFNREDKWEIPTLNAGGSTIQQSALYVLAKLPESEKFEMLVIRPMLPANKKNMVSWIAARMDGEHYGELVSLEFPTQKQFTGPEQAQGLIERDDDIKQDRRLLEGETTPLQTGELVVLPISDSLIYVQPYYLISDSASLPELVRVAVVFDETVAWDNDLEGALAKLFEKRTGEASPPASDLGDDEAGKDEADESDEDTSASDASLEETIDELNDAFAQAETCQREGDWECYGEQQARVRELIAQADNLS